MDSGGHNARIAYMIDLIDEMTMSLSTSSIYKNSRYVSTGQVRRTKQSEMEAKAGRDLGVVQRREIDELLVASRSVRVSESERQRASVYSSMNRRGEPRPPGDAFAAPPGVRRTSLRPQEAALALAS